MNRLLWMLLGAQLWPLVRAWANAVADVTVIGGLLGFGCHLNPTNYGLITVRVVLFATVHLMVLAGCLAACWWAFRKKGRTFANTAAALLRRPLFVPILACAILLPVLWCVSAGTQVLLMRWLPPPTNGGLCATTNIASIWTSLVVSVAGVVLTVLLGRRQLRLRTNS